MREREEVTGAVQEGCLGHEGRSGRVEPDLPDAAHSHSSMALFLSPGFPYTETRLSIKDAELPKPWVFLWGVSRLGTRTM